MINNFDPELYLDHADRAQLLATTSTEGYKIIHKILRAEVGKFFLAWLNTDHADDAKVLATHRMAKSAAQFYQGATERINKEIQEYLAIKSQSDKPVDVTEGLIDIGEVASELPDITIPGGV